MNFGACKLLFLASCCCFWRTSSLLINASSEGIILNCDSSFTSTYLKILSFISKYCVGCLSKQPYCSAYVSEPASGTSLNTEPADCFACSSFDFLRASSSQSQGNCSIISHALRCSAGSSSSSTFFDRRVLCVPLHDALSLRLE